MMKKVMILSGFLLLGVLQASENDTESPKTVARNLSDTSLLSDENEKNGQTLKSSLLYADDSASINENGSDNEDDLAFFDAHEGDLLLTSQDITAPDQYSGYDTHFDQLYQFAKRDLHLAQQHERMFPDQKNSYESLKEYYRILSKQRQEMAAIKQAMGEQNRIAFDANKLNINLFKPSAQKELVKIKNAYSRIYRMNVIPSQSKKLLKDYKMPYESQLELNRLSLLKAEIILEQLQMLQK